MNSQLSAFDLDHTLLNSNSSFRFGFYLYDHGFIKFSHLIKCLFYYAQHKWFNMSIEDLHNKSFVTLFKGRSSKEVEQYVETFLTHYLVKMTNHNILYHLDSAKKEGHHCVILSGAPDFLVRPIAEKWGIKLWYATTYQCDQKGNYSRIGHVMEGEKKAKTLMELAGLLKVNPSAITVYSDCSLDLPILNAAGTAIGVYPDRKLRKLCFANKWQILE